MDYSLFDFLDLGASQGGSIEFAKQKLDGKRGLGIDIDPGKVAFMRNHGYDCIEGDVTTISINHKFRFVVMNHVLEHLPSIGLVHGVLSKAASVATDFLYIRGPYFDEDPYLGRSGFKLYWSDWSGHKSHVTTAQILDILTALNLNDYSLFVRGRIDDSSDERIHPLSSPPNQHQYVEGQHPPKKVVEFDRSIWSEFVLFVFLREFEERYAIPSKIRGLTMVQPASR